MPIPTFDLLEVYSKDSELKKSDVESLQEWASKQPHLPKISEVQAVLFLQSCYYSNELAKVTMDNYFTVKTLCPDIFGNRNLKDPSVQEAINVTKTFFFNKKHPKGYSVLLFAFNDFDSDKFNFSLQIRKFDMLELLNLHQFGPQQGFVALFDTRGLTLAHVLRISPVVVKKLTYYVQEALPIRLKGIHFLFSPALVNKILLLIKPFFKKEFASLIHSHETLEEVYKFVPKECFPVDYGGQSDPSDILYEKSKKQLNDNAEYFAYEESQVVDESKRPGKPKNTGDFFGVEGTFKKLEID